MQLVENHVWCEVNIEAIIHNYNVIKKISKLPMYATVKADAYGHGAPYISKIYQDLDISGLSVSSFSEAIQLRKSGITKPILILGYTEPKLATELALNNLTQSIISLEYAKELDNYALYPLDCHIKIDTGMGRLGFDMIYDKDKALNEMFELQNLQNLRFSGLYTHFASSDMVGKFYLNYTQNQINLFNEVKYSLLKKGFNIKLFHGQNSGGVARKLESEFNMLRPGCILYGYYPSNEVIMPDLIPALDLKSIVTHIKPVKKGQFIGYGLTYEVENNTNIATVCCGYADGLPRTLSGTNHLVKINGEDYPIIGRICMDQFMVDIGNNSKIKSGDEVLVIGGEGNQSFHKTATKLSTLPGNLLCSLNKRAPRVYLKYNQVVHITNNI